MLAPATTLIYGWCTYCLELCDMVSSGQRQEASGDIFVNGSEGMPNAAPPILLANERCGFHQQVVRDPIARDLRLEELYERAHYMPTRISSWGGGERGCG